MNVDTIKYNDHGWIKDPKSSLQRCLDSLTTLFPPQGTFDKVNAPPMNIHNMHYLNTFPTSSTFHFNITQINIISSQWHYQQQLHHFILTYSPIITSIHVDIIIIINFISNQYHHKYQHHHISIKFINSNINNKSHFAYTYIFNAWDSHSSGLQTTWI